MIKVFQTSSIGESYIRRSIISTKTPYGFKIACVRKDSPAALAGWRKGDILLTFDDKPLEFMAVGLHRKTMIVSAKPN